MARSARAGVPAGASASGSAQTPGTWFDVDLDGRLAVTAAPVLLPRTGLRCGRPSNPGSHWQCRSKGYKTAKAQGHPDGVAADGKGMIVEGRADGYQSVLPPSVHPSHEPCAWEAEYEPVEVEPGELARRVALVWAAVVCAKRWPDLGARHEASLALAGFLLRGGMDVDEAQKLVRAITLCVDSTSVDAHARCIDDTASKLAEGEAVTGEPGPPRAAPRRRLQPSTRSEAAPAPGGDAVERGRLRGLILRHVWLIAF